MQIWDTHTQNLQLENKFDVYRQQTILLHVLIQEFAVKIIPDCVIDEPLGSLELSSCLVLEDNIIIPPALNSERGWIHEGIAPHKLCFLHFHFLILLLPFLLSIPQHN
jgi:hypothetical protein